MSILSNKNLHESLMKEFLTGLNKNSNDYVLKGGTALYFCYDLDRFSTDIDIDSKRNLNTYVDTFCKKHGFDYFIKKNTDSVNRYNIHYNKDSESSDDVLKIEISHRKYNNKLNVVKKNGILTYDINTLFAMKILAGTNRIKIRDLYDICFIYNKYQNELNDTNISYLEDFLEIKGNNYFEYLVKEEGNDEVIDIKKFEDYYLKMIEDLTDKKM